MTVPTNELDAETMMDEKIIEAMARAMNTATDGHDRYWTGYLKSAEAALNAARPLLSASAAAAIHDDEPTTRAVIQPLEEPVTIAKAMLAGRVASVVLDKDIGPVAAVHLVNIGITGWVHTRETAEAYAKGFNTAAAWMQSALAARHAVPDAEPAVNAMNALKRARDGWQEEAASLAKRLKYMEADNDLLRKHQSNDVWHFQGDGEDHIESMGNNMVVVIHAHDLRSLISAAQAQRGEPVAWTSSTRLARVKKNPGHVDTMWGEALTHDGDDNVPLYAAAQPAQTERGMADILRQVAALKRYGLEHHVSGKGRSSVTVNVPKELLAQIDVLITAHPASGAPA